jgi:two-component system chemotaxis response regulator CheB
MDTVAVNSLPTVSFPVVAIGASAGGIDALWALLAALPKDLPAAVLVVLHIPAHSESILDKVLAMRSALPVKAVNDGEPLRAGQVYVPRVDHHLMIDGPVIRSTRGPKECRARPVINVPFRSVAESCGSRAIGVILSGMLDDGTAGLWEIKERGGRAYVQEPGDARHDSMPRSALEHVAVDGVATAAGLASLIEDAVVVAGAASPTAFAGLGLESRFAVGTSRREDAVYQMGSPSRYSCPECHGVLAEIVEGSIIRFRCHTGHGYSMQTLAAEIDQDIDDSLWKAARGLEEKMMLIERACENSGTAQGRAELERVRVRLDTLRALLLSSQFAPVPPNR